MAVYICSKCFFTFERSGEVNVCPGCGRMNIRYADEEETEEFRVIQAELQKGENTW